jgi:hypothetical protein
MVQLWYSSIVVVVVVAAGGGGGGARTGSGANIVAGPVVAVAAAEGAGACKDSPRFSNSSS